MLGKALLLLSGNAATAVLSLARNLLVARLLQVADYGIAATFVMAMAVVETVSALGLHQQIVRDPKGDEPRFQAVLQALQLVRGLAAGLILLAIAHPVAAFLGIPHVAWAYQLLALVPVLNALQHFDIHRLNRQMRYGPLLLTGTVPAFVSLLLVWPLAAILGDWRVMLWAILAQALLAAAVSHGLAERPWRIAWDGPVVARSLRFGIPIILDAVLLFLVFHGEKLIIGRVLGMEALGLFAMGVTLTLMPTIVMAKSAQNLFLPKLSAVDGTTPEGTARFRRLASAAVEVHLVAGTVLLVGMVLLGGPFVLLVLGEKYAGLVPLLVPMAAMQALRVFKGGPAIIALACAQTENATAANIARAALLPIAWIVAERTGRADLVIAVGILGEAIGLVVAFWLLRRRIRVPLRLLIRPLTGSIAVVVAALLAPWGKPLLGASAMTACILVVFVASLLCVRHLWRKPL